jgi:hypothetical protein
MSQHEQEHERKQKSGEADPKIRVQDLFEIGATLPVDTDWHVSQSTTDQCLITRLSGGKQYAKEQHVLEEVITCIKGMTQLDFLHAAKIRCMLMLRYIFFGH